MPMACLSLPLPAMPSTSSPYDALCCGDPVSRTRVANRRQAIVCIICCVYYIVAHFGPPSLYNYWAILALDIFLVIFWLISFSLMAAEVAPFLKGYTYCDYYYGTCSTYALSGLDLVFAACMAAVAGLGGLEL